MGHFSLNTSRKPEQSLNSNLIAECINIYGIRVKWLYSNRVNEDEVFLDFSHFKVNTDLNEDIYKDITILPEDTSSWENENNFGIFGYYNNQHINAYISRNDILLLYPMFEDDTEDNFSDILNSLLILPSSTILEVTNIEQYHPGINNLYAYSDAISSYKLTMKVYDINLSDEGVKDISTNINLDELQEGVTPEEKIFEYNEPIDTEIDDFFNQLAQEKNNQDQRDTISTSGGVFGDLS